MTSGGITRPRPLMTANWAAWVRAAPSECGNQVTIATTPVAWKARSNVSGTRGLADTLPDGMGGVNHGRAGTGPICFAILRCERAGKPSTYTHVRLGLPTRSRLVWLATCPSARARLTHYRAPRTRP